MVHTINFNKCALCAVFLVSGLVGCRQAPDALGVKHLAKGQEFSQKQDYSRGILEYRNALRAAPNDAEIYCQLGEALVATGELPEAVAAFRQALEVNPKHVRAELRLAQRRSSTGDIELLRQSEGRLKTLMENAPADREMLSTLALT